MAAEKVDNECCITATTVRQPKMSFLYDSSGVLVRVMPVDGVLQLCIPAGLGLCLLGHSHYSQMARHADE